MVGVSKVIRKLLHDAQHLSLNHKLHKTGSPGKIGCRVPSKEVIPVPLLPRCRASSRLPGSLSAAPFWSARSPQTPRTVPFRFRRKVCGCHHRKESSLSGWGLLNEILLYLCGRTNRHGLVAQCYKGNASKGSNSIIVRWLETNYRGVL